MPKLETEGRILDPKRIKRKVSFVRYFFISMVGLVILLAATAFYFYRKSNHAPNASQGEVASLIQKVGKLAVLPEGETPTVATVSDPSALKNQSFFANAKKGDKVLIYSNAKEAILYDPVLNRIVNMAPLNVGTSPTVPAGTPSSTTSASPSVQKQSQGF